MDAHGPKIESLEISTDTPRLIMAGLVEKCPAIREVSFGVDLEPVAVISVPLEQLRTIGLTGLRVLDTHDGGRVVGCLRSKCEKISKSLAHLPMLRVLRLVDFDPAQLKYLGQKQDDAEWWEEQVGYWASLDIRLEDRYGNLVMPPDGASSFITYAKTISCNDPDSDSSSSSYYHSRH